MPLINCPECKSTVSGEAEICPKCGYRILGREHLVRCPNCDHQVIPVFGPENRVWTYCPLCKNRLKANMGPGLVIALVLVTMMAAGIAIFLLTSFLRSRPQ